MLCCKIHNHEAGCQQNIPERGNWKYCPACGCSTGHIETPDLSFDVKRGTEEKKVAFLRNTGLAPVTVTLSLDAAVPGVQFAPGQRSVLVVHPRMPEKVEIIIPPLQTRSEALGVLRILSEDAPLQSEDNPWEPRDPRAIHVTISARIETPANAHPMEEALLFRDGVSKRTITMVNNGHAPVDVLHVTPPNGYRVRFKDETRRIGGRNGTLAFTVERDWSVEDARSEDLLTIRTSDDLLHDVGLFCESGGEVRPLPRAIIGVDFGTTFTSVAYRECRHHPKVQDDVEFLKPPGDEERFPSVIWMDKQTGAMFFGKQANDQWYQDLGKTGYRFREIKTLLRGYDDIGEVKVDPIGMRAEAVNFARERFGESWPEALVTEFLRWVYNNVIRAARSQQSEVDVRYVVSVPVLDYAFKSASAEEARKMHELQRAAMERCVASAGFPWHPDPARNRVEFEFEPVCATIGLLHPPRDVEQDTTGKGASLDRWPVLGSPGYQVKDGDTVVVFDSGGGTTDVVLATVRFDSETGEISLAVERCLGVGHEGETFGGEWVTDQVWEALKTPQKVVLDEQGNFRTDWWQGDLRFDGLKDDPTDPKSPLSRETAEEVKFTLAEDRRREIEYTNPVGVTAITPRLLIYLVFQRLRSLSEALRERIFDHILPATVKYYLFVGGNTRLMAIRRWAEIFMGEENPDVTHRRLLLPDRYRQLAVAFGASWVPDARIRNAVPYDLDVIAGSMSLLSLPRNTSQDIVPISQDFEMPASRELEICVRATVGARSFVVGRATVHNSFPHRAIAEVWTGLQQGRLRINSRCFDPSNPDTKGPLETLLEYEL
jgi:hypothetical protein